MALADMAPFMGPEDEKVHRGVNVTRIIEALIIAAVIGAINVLGTSKAFEERFKYIKVQMDEIKQSIRRIESDVYHPYYRKDP